MCAKIIIGVDHGNGNMKTEHTVFPCAFQTQDIKPSEYFASDVIEYKGKYYILSNNDRIPYETDKTTNKNAIILTLFSIAKEIVAREAEGKPNYDMKRDFKGFVGKDVVLAVGLPPAHVERMGKSFKQYFEEEFRHGVEFKYNDKTFNFYVADIDVYPQDYAGAIIFYGEQLEQYTTVYCIDIGDGTVDLVGVEKGKPDKSTIVSIERGMSALRYEIKNKIINDFGAKYTLSDNNIDDLLNGKNFLPPQIRDEITRRVDEIAMTFTRNLINEIGKNINFFINPVIFMGGGAIALKRYLEATEAFGMPYFCDDIHVNAIGYQEITRIKRTNM